MGVIQRNKTRVATLFHLIRWFALPRGDDFARFVDILLEPPDDFRHPLTCIFFGFRFRGRLLRVARCFFRRPLHHWLWYWLTVRFFYSSWLAALHSPTYPRPQFSDVYSLFGDEFAHLLDFSIPNNNEKYR